ncbi:MAG TPA: L,D-transpeptidase family protein [Sphingomicrobium sp.]|nr:L,D-transpeptidase family protein [Sphingomicrobium sp.]
MNRLLFATVPLLLIGGAAATALALRSQDHARAAPRVEAPPAPHDRIALSPAQVREAYSAGLIDHPIKTILNVPHSMTYGEFIWDDKGVPAGPTWIRVDLHAQLMSVFRSGHEIGTAVVLYGADGLPTPTGKFPILAKLKDHRSITYDNAPMPYTLRLTPDGVSIHGSNVRWGFATHGCIGIPKAFAAKVFDVVKAGDEVLIVSGKARSKGAPAA